MIDLIVKGGVFMFPIILCSILALAVFLERLWVLRRNRIIPDVLIREVGELLTEKKVSKALSLCQGDTSPISNIFSAGLKRSGKGMSHEQE